MLARTILICCVIVRLEMASIVMTCQEDDPGHRVAHNTCITCSLFYTSFKIIPAMTINFITQTGILHYS